MGKRQKKSMAPWKPFLWGNLVAWAGYLGGLLLAALLAVKGVLPESAAFPMVAALCALCTFGGGVVAVHGCGWGSLWSALVNTVVFAAVLIVVGLACWMDGVSWAGRGGAVLLCALVGGLGAAMVGGRTGRRRKRK